MKLRTKFQDEHFDLEEVVDVDIATMPDSRIKAQARAMRGGLHTFFYKTKAEFDADWEDAPEEPKQEWYINENNEPQQVSFSDPIDDIKHLREIGLLFDTEEECGQAIKRMKAWTRLKDKGFKITMRRCKGYAWLEANWGNLQGDYSDVRLLFGGEKCK